MRQKVSLFQRLSAMTALVSGAASGLHIVWVLIVSGLWQKPPVRAFRAVPRMQVGGKARLLVFAVR